MSRSSLAVIAAAGLLFSSEAAAQDKTIAVFAVENESDFSRSTAEQLDARLRAELSRQTLRLISRAELEKNQHAIIERERAAPFGTCDEPLCRLVTARDLAADCMIRATLSGSADEWVLELALFDALSGERLETVVRRGSGGTQALLRSISSVAVRAAEQLQRPVLARR